MESWTIGDMRQRHQQTRFPLVGRHLDASCENCHERASANRFAGTPTACIACHRTEYLATAQPSHTTMGFDVDCSSCHRPTALEWPGSFDHNLTAFPLTGAHQALLCSQCHPNNAFTKRATDCFSCHAGDYTQAASPVHVGFSHECASCHTTTAWSPATFDHNQTQFALTGAHAGAPCQSCHVGGNFQLTYVSCVQCHDNDFRQASNPNHLTNGFTQDCRSCHTTTAWHPATFDHAATNFALTGAHVVASCLSCHVGGNYRLTYTDCYQCHQADFQRPTDPNHVSAQLSHNCVPCHTTTAWSPASFDHGATGFALTGAHVTTPCISCHVGGNYQLAYADCYQCHQADFQRPTDPNHVSAQFSHNCVPCHTTTAWSPASFDHGATGFALTGAHVATPCASCHVGGNYQLAYTDCYQCHQADFQRPTDPNHVSAQFSHNCQPCHTTTAWTPASFDHGTTAFPLTGAHVSTACQSCHVGGNYQLAYQSCYQCHQADYEGVVDPNHVLSNLDHNCTTCHTTTAWVPSTFNHDTQAFRIYSGRHLQTWTTCATCHTTPGNYQAFSCFSCHQHNQADTDSHHTQVSGYIYASPACYSCHRNV
jgi:hypothetical protein